MATNTFKSYVLQGIGITPTTVYTGVGQATVIGLSVANTTASAITVDVTLTKGATTVYLIKSCPVPVGSSAVVVGGDQKVVCEVGNTIKVTSSAAASVDVVISMLEIT
jgi:hypothetical protein